MFFYFSFLLAQFSFAPVALAESEYCGSKGCDLGQSASYPHTPLGEDYGRDVKLGAGGGWIDRSGHRVWANEGSQRSRVISMNNSDQRNGELAYQTAYDSYIFGKNNGLNKVQHVKNGGRWVRKITTGDGIVIFKDQAGNVAVQAPDGRWHVTDAHGEYASSSFDLEREMPSKEMVAEKEPKNTRGEGRKPASVTEKSASPALEEESGETAPAEAAAPAKAAAPADDAAAAPAEAAAPAKAATPADDAGAAPAEAAASTKAAAPAEAAAPAAAPAEAAASTKAAASAEAAAPAAAPAEAAASTKAAAPVEAATSAAVPKAPVPAASTASVSPQATSASAAASSAVSQAGPAPASSTAPAAVSAATAPAAADAVKAASK